MLHERVVWITGASAGIGQALVETIPWTDVLVVGVSRRGLGETRCHGDGVTYEGVVVDLSKPPGWDVVRTSFEAHLHSGLTEAVFIHAAASVGPLGFAGQVDEAAYSRAVILNTASPPVLGEMFIREIEKVKVRAQIVMLTSGSSVQKGWTAYKAGKAGMSAWVHATGRALDARSASCRVLAVAPGLVETGMQEELRTADPATFPARGRFTAASRNGLPRSPADVAGDLWELLVRGEEPNGAILDLRDRLA